MNRGCQAGWPTRSGRPDHCMHARVLACFPVCKQSGLYPKVIFWVRARVGLGHDGNHVGRSHGLRHVLWTIPICLHSHMPLASWLNPWHSDKSIGERRASSWSASTQSATAGSAQSTQVSYDGACSPTRMPSGRSCAAWRQAACRRTSRESLQPLATKRRVSRRRSDVEELSARIPFWATSAVTEASGRADGRRGTEGAGSV